MKLTSPLFLPMLILACLWGVALLIIVPRKSEGDAKLNEIRGLLNAVPVYPGAREVDFFWSDKALHTVAEKSYQSDVRYDELKSYYIEQLKPLGWRLIAEKSVKDWWRDLGGRELTFQRGDYLLNIEFAGEKADYGWNYAISITS